MSFNISSPMLTDNALETKVQISLEEENKSKNTLDEKLIAYVPEPYSKETKPFSGFDLNKPLVDQLYLNNIFKPPKFS